MNLKQVEEFLEKWIPQIAEFVKTHITPRLKHVIQDDKKLERILNLTYRLMPFPARFLVSKEKFVEFILKNKNRIFPPAPDASTATETV